MNRFRTFVIFADRSCPLEKATCCYRNMSRGSHYLSDEENHMKGRRDQHGKSHALADTHIPISRSRIASEWLRRVHLLISLCLDIEINFAPDCPIPIVQGCQSVDMMMLVDSSFPSAEDPERLPWPPNPFRCFYPASKQSPSATMSITTHFTSYSCVLLRKKNIYEDPT